MKPMGPRVLASFGIGTLSRAHARRNARDAGRQHPFALVADEKADAGHARALADLLGLPARAGGAAQPAQHSLPRSPARLLHDNAGRAYRLPAHAAPVRAAAGPHRS